MQRNAFLSIELIRRSAVVAVAALGIFSSASIIGCSEQSNTRSDSGPQIRPVAFADTDRPVRPKPLPAPGGGEMPPAPFDDAPLVYQPVPEQKAFLEAYAAVNRPRMVVFVNRSLQGDALPVDLVDHRDETYLRPGQYDEVYAKQIDYAAVENTLTQWLACEGQTTIASPAAVRERLTADEIVKLQSGRPRLLGDLAKDLNADILILVQAKPTRQTERGLEVRLIAEAINIAHGESIARANVLIPPPLDTEKNNRFTRYIARRLMTDMMMTWSGPSPAKAPQLEVPPRNPAEAPVAPPTQTPPVVPPEKPMPLPGRSSVTPPERAVPESPAPIAPATPAAPPATVPAAPPAPPAPGTGGSADATQPPSAILLGDRNPDRGSTDTAAKPVPQEKPTIMDRPGK